VNGAQRSLTEILRAAQSLWNVDKQKLYRDLNRMWARSNVSYTAANPETYINQILNKLQSFESTNDSVYLRAVYLRARDIANSTRMNWEGKSPLRVATFCVYLADTELGYKIGTNRLCAVVGIDPEILRSYKASFRHSQEAERNDDEGSSVRVEQIFLERESRTFRSSLHSSEEKSGSE